MLKKTKFKSAAKKVVSISMVVILNVILMLPNRFNDSSEVSASEQVAYSEYYEPSTFNKIYEGQSEPIILESGDYKFKNLQVTSSSSAPAIRIIENSTVHIWLEGDNRFYGGNGENACEGGYPGISVPENATLYIHGKGNLYAQGGKGKDAENGDNGYIRNTSSLANYNNEYVEALGKLCEDFNDNCGRGGNGGGGGGAAIGTAGSRGGEGGKKVGKYKDDGKNGETPAKCGTVYFLSTGKTELVAGQGGSGGKGGDGKPSKKEEVGQIELQENCFFEGGGGGGGGGSNGHAFGSGGAGGGGGGNCSTAGNLDSDSEILDYISSKGIKPKTLIYLPDVTHFYRCYVSMQAFNGGAGGGGGGAGGKSGKVGGGGGGGGGFVRFHRSDKEDSSSSRINFYNGSYPLIKNYMPQYYNWGKAGLGGAEEDGKNGENYGENFSIPEIIKYYPLDEHLHMSYNDYNAPLMKEIFMLKEGYIYVTNRGESVFLRNVAFGGIGGKAGIDNKGGTGGEIKNTKNPEDPLKMQNSEYNFVDSTFQTIGESGIVTDQKSCRYITYYGASIESPSEGAGDGGNGGEDVESGTAYRSKNSSYEYTDAEVVEDLYSIPLSIVKSGSKLSASSTATIGTYNYNWEIDGKKINNDNGGEIKLLSSYTGKKLKLILETNNETVGNIYAIGKNEVEYEFKIDLQECNIEPMNPDIIFKDGKYCAEYSGSKINPNLKISYYDIDLIENAQYTVTCISGNDMIQPSGNIYLEINPDESVGDAIYDSKDSEGQKLHFMFSIISKELRPTSCRISPTEFIYNGQPQRPQIRVLKEDSTESLVEGTHYQVMWSDSSTDAYEKIPVIISGIPSTGYSGEVTLYYRISPLDISTSNLVVKTPSLKFTGQPLTTEIEISNSIGTLVEGIDYDIQWPDDITSVGEKKFTVKGKGNYTGSLTGSYSIEGTNIDNFTVLIDPEAFEYNREIQMPEVSVFNENGNKLEENINYEISWPQNIIDAETKEFTVKGISENGYGGEISKSYVITPVDAKKVDIKLNKDQFYYNGDEMIPEMSVQYLDKDLSEGKDYMVRLSSDLVSPGEKTIIFDFYGNYTGTRTLSYTIQKAEFECTYGDNLSISVIDFLSNNIDKTNMDFYISSENGNINATINSNGILNIGSNSSVGEYNLSINEKNSGAAIHIVVIINKATPIVQIENKSAVYSGEPVDIDNITVKLKNNEVFNGSISYDYYTDAACNSILTDLPRNVGTYYVKAYIDAPNENYNTTISEPAQITILKADQILEGSTYYYGHPGEYMYLDIMSDLSQELMYQSDDENIVQIESGGKMNLISAGTTTIKAYAPETENYNGASLSAIVEVTSDINTSPFYSNYSNSSIQKLTPIDNPDDADYDENSAGNSEEDGNLADDIWNKILETGDKSIYIITTATILAGLSIVFFIITKRKK